MRLGIAGVNGRMGRLLIPAIHEAGATLVGGIDPAGAPDGVRLFPDIAALAAACDAVLDFSTAATALPHAAALSAARTAWVLGTTGLDDAATAALTQAATRIAIVQAANFSPGVTLLLALAERLGAALPADTYDAEILELHHRHKIDAPSGTALALGQAVAAGRGTAMHRRPHAGPREIGQIGFATQRGGEIVGEHTLSFTASAEQITLSHRAFDRAAFAEGAVRAALWLSARPPGRYGMVQVMGM